jgi:NO-binding membrane sensor protein with MHYT domain
MPIDPSLPLAGAYDYRLVVLSVVISTLASYAALDLGGRVTAARGLHSPQKYIGGQHLLDDVSLLVIKAHTL